MDRQVGPIILFFSKRLRALANEGTTLIQRSCTAILKKSLNENIVKITLLQNASPLDDRWQKF